MRHYVMTSSRWDYPLDRNARRIELARRITARSMAAQAGDWTWIVYVHPEDPLLSERLAAFAEAGRPVVPVYDNADAEWAIDWSDDVLTTRIDDDDAFAGDAFARLYGAFRDRLSIPMAFLFPVGYHVKDGRVGVHVHRRNAWASVFSPVGRREHVRLHQHQRIPGAYPVTYVDDRPAWLRVSHADNDRPTSRRPHQPITSRIRALYPVDWSLLERQAVAA